MRTPAKKDAPNMSKPDFSSLFTCEDFDLTRVKARNPTMCPVKSCSTKLSMVPYRKRDLPFCSTHGIRLHSKTFVYRNGTLGLRDASLRNFMVRLDLAKEVALQSGQKAETSRLGYEMSEDALTWNVFVSLAEAGVLREAAHFLIGRDIGGEPDLYLWGQRVDVNGGTSGPPFPQLDKTRRKLEGGIGRFKTEPDIMFVLNDRLIICIEAKFGSGNPLAYPGRSKAGDKPTDRDGLIERYLDQASPRTKEAIDRNGIGETFHSQLFRNVVFASEMASGGEWHVVNLVSETLARDPQGKLREASDRYSFDDPRPHVRLYLRSDYQSRFHFNTWEGLYVKVVRNAPRLAPLGTYIRTKSAHYERAFRLE